MVTLDQLSLTSRWEPPEMISPYYLEFDDSALQLSHGHGRNASKLIKKDRRVGVLVDGPDLSGSLSSLARLRAYLF